MAYDYLFFGDSFTYGEDAETVDDTWPAQYLSLVGKADSVHKNCAQSGQSNSGMLLDVLQVIDDRAVIDSNTIVFIGLSNIFRDATGVSVRADTGTASYWYQDVNYNTANAHVSKPWDKMLAEYSSYFALEHEKILAAKNFSYYVTLSKILGRIGCTCYLVDVLFDCKYVQDLLSLEDHFFEDVISFGDTGGLVKYIRDHYPDIKDTASHHFDKTGYGLMAELIHNEMHDFKQLNTRKNR